MSNLTRTEQDGLGTKDVPKDALYGIHTVRALENFKILDQPIHPEWIRAYGWVKWACVRQNRKLGVWSDEKKIDAMEQACQEMSEGLLISSVPVDALQGGAGTSINMGINEVLSNRALAILGISFGSYSIISPTEDFNRHQSTNDTCPTALKLASIRMIRQLEQAVVDLQDAFQRKEREWVSIVKVGRTQLQDAVLTTLGREMGAMSEALSRDRWRIYKCEERLRVVNLGGTAIGTGLGAPRDYIFGVVEELRQLTQIGFSRAENLIDSTQNLDVFVEVSGMLKALAATLFKLSNDLRWLSSGPHAGLAEIKLPDVQVGSSIMPGKVNPVILEAACQTAMLVMGYDMVITMAVSQGNLELNSFLPLIGFALLSNLQALTNSVILLRTKCIDGMTAYPDRCKAYVETSSATATALVPYLGYEKASELVHLARSEQISLRDYVIQHQWMTLEDFEQAISPESVTKLGFILKPFNNQKPRL